MSKVEDYIRFVDRSITLMRAYGRKAANCLEGDPAKRHFEDFAWQIQKILEETGNLPECYRVRSEKPSEG